MKKARLVFSNIDGGVNNKVTVIEKCLLAQTFTERLVGLLGHASLQDDEALLLHRCNQVHTLFMRFPIDIVVLNAANVVVGCKGLKPWRLSPFYFSGSKIIEIPWGQVQKRGIARGQKVEVIECSS